MRRLIPRPCRRPVLGTLLLGWLATTGAQSARADDPSNRIAVEVIFDTSGSMKATIPSQSAGRREAKLAIAQRSFGLVIDRLQTFLKGPNAKPLSIGVYVFTDTKATVALPLAPFDAPRLRQWLAGTTANASTPLGDAIFLAGRDLLAAPAASRHLLVLTDGENTTGRSPEDALRMLNEVSDRKQTPVFTHIIALDIKPDVFAALKKQGATLIGAADEAQLNAQFDFILEEKILVEAPR